MPESPSVGQTTAFPGGVDPSAATYDPSIGPAVTALENYALGVSPLVNKTLVVAGDVNAAASYQGPTLTGVVAQALPEFAVTAHLVGTAGSVVIGTIYLPQGTVVNNLSFVCQSSASTPTHQAAGLASILTTSKVLVSSADGTTAAIAAGTLITYAMTAAYTVPVSGNYYYYVLVAGTTGPTWSGGTAYDASGRAAVTPYNNGIGATGLSAIQAVGATLVQPTSNTVQVQVYVN